MANVLTPFIPTLYTALDQVSRELVGFIPSVARNSSAERAAVDESVTIPITRAATLANVVPSMTVPAPTDFALDNVTMKITKAKQFNFGFTGEEQLGVNNGVGMGGIVADQFKQGIRAICNEMEADLALEGAIASSRAFGTAGTTPFASNLSELAQVRKILDDNGCPLTERALVMDTAAGASLRSLQQLTKTNEAGTEMTLRTGELLNVFDFSLKESAGVVRPVIGTSNNAGTSNTAGYAIGATAITMAAAGTGTVLSGDVVTFAGDTNKYVVETGVANLAAGGVLTLQAPGLRVALPASAFTLTVVARSARNIAFTRSAIQLITRAPALPNGTDAAIDSYMFTDPRSGLSFEARVYAGYRQMRMEIAAAWGVKAIKPAHIATLLG